MQAILVNVLVAHPIGSEPLGSYVGGFGGFNHHWVAAAAEVERYHAINLPYSGNRRAQSDARPALHGRVGGIGERSYHLLPGIWSAGAALGGAAPGCAQQFQALMIVIAINSVVVEVPGISTTYSVGAAVNGIADMCRLAAVDVPYQHSVRWQIAVVGIGRGLAVLEKEVFIGVRG